MNEELKPLEEVEETSSDEEIVEETPQEENPEEVVEEAQPEETPVEEPSQEEQAPEETPAEEIPQEEVKEEQPEEKPVPEEPVVEKKVRDPNVKVYFFHPSEKKRLSYEMTDVDGKVVYEAKLTKFHHFKPFEYEFKNNIKGTHKKHDIGRSMNMDMGLRRGKGAQLNSYYSYDGLNIWTYISSNNVRMGFKNNTTYVVYLLNNPIATITLVHPEFTLENELIDDKKFKRGYYMVETMNMNLDVVFLIAFTMARTAISYL